MPNSYFRFKQFTVHHDRCAMKVGTDGVLLGAWADPANADRILDVGTGTGLIALMLAQRSTALIDAVEIDIDACEQARENVLRSPWATRIQIHCGSIQNYIARGICPSHQQGEKSDRHLYIYDLIVANPPFFENVSKTPDLNRNTARHNDRLSQADLLQVASQLLSEKGRMTVIYPTETAQAFQKKAEVMGLFTHRILHVKTTATSPVKRTLIEIGRLPFHHDISTLTLATTHSDYTPEFINLIKDFYLKY